MAAWRRRAQTTARRGASARDGGVAAAPAGSEAFDTDPPYAILDEPLAQEPFARCGLAEARGTAGSTSTSN
ncbi:hypothetical protein ACFWGM_35460, partial [Streptomyces roseolus]|uniref:hypothetical protein n=1 Tax=Streptomyces roseolus TaxID=67358 RepID=UPI00364C9EF2